MAGPTLMVTVLSIALRVCNCRGLNVNTGRVDKEEIVVGEVDEAPSANQH